MVRIQCPDGGEEQLLARAVIDASGTWRTPNPLGADGLPALGEAAAADQIFYGIPDVLGRDRARYAGKRVVVVGSGHSAFNALLELATLADQAPGTESPGRCAAAGRSAVRRRAERRAARARPPRHADAPSSSTVVPSATRRCASPRSAAPSSACCWWVRMAQPSARSTRSCAPRASVPTWH